MLVKRGKFQIFSQINLTIVIENHNLVCITHFCASGLKYDAQV